MIWGSMISIRVEFGNRDIKDSGESDQLDICYEALPGLYALDSVLVKIDALELHSVGKSALRHGRLLLKAKPAYYYS